MKKELYYCDLYGNPYTQQYVDGYWAATTEIKELINHHSTTKKRSTWNPIGVENIK